MLLGRILSLLAVVAAGAIATASTHAQTGAQQPLRMLVPLPAGSTSDLVARLLVDPLRTGLGRPVVVENRPGASGRIAVDALRSAAPDGATVLVAPIAVPVIGPLVFRNPSYDPAKDLVPVSQVARYEFALAVAASHPARTVSEFVAWARANPPRASIGNPGAGTLPHFLGVMIGHAGGVELVQVAYKGAGVLANEAIGGHLAAGVSAISDFAPLHRAGKLRILASTGATRAALLPDVPTFREQGYPAVDASGWHGVFAPAGTPQAAVDRLSAVIVAALEAPSLREKFVALGLEPTGTTPERLAAIMAADTAHWQPIIKATGFTAE